MELNQYAIVLVNLDPMIGSEIKKTRPCVIISPNEMNRHLQTIVIAPMTTNTKNYPTRVAVELNSMKGMIVLDQIRTVDKSRILKIIGQLNPTQIATCKSIIREIYVD